MRFFFGSHSHRRSKPVRQNLDAFTDASGIVHPIRGSEGYSDIILGWHSGERKRYGMDAAQQQMEKRWPEYGKTMQKSRELGELEIERDALAEQIRDDPASGLTDLMRVHGKARGEVNLIPFGQARPVLRRVLGKSPESFKTAIVKKGPHKYLRWEYALDDMAQILGYRSDESLKNAIERAARDKSKLDEMDARIVALRDEL